MGKDDISKIIPTNSGPMENEFLMATSKLILTQPGGGGIYLADMGDLRAVQAPRCS